MLCHLFLEVINITSERVEVIRNIRIKIRDNTLIYEKNLGVEVYPAVLFNIVCLQFSVTFNIFKKCGF